jgi:hypothetical protein
VAEFSLLDQSSGSPDPAFLGVRPSGSSGISELALVTGLQKIPPPAAIKSAHSLLQNTLPGIAATPDPVQQHAGQQQKQLPRSFSCMFCHRCD